MSPPGGDQPLPGEAPAWPGAEIATESRRRELRGRGAAALVEEAVARYLAEEDERRRRSDRARAVLGTLEEEDAAAIGASIDAARAASV